MINAKAGTVVTTEGGGGDWGGMHKGLSTEP